MKTALEVLYRFPQHALILLVKSYRLLLSPSLGSACRFEPACSAYSLQALNEHGAVVGASLTLYRLVRCQPWCRGGHDPVPDPARVHALFTRLLRPIASHNPSPSSSPEKNSP